MVGVSACDSRLETTPPARTLDLWGAQTQDPGGGLSRTHGHRNHGDAVMTGHHVTGWDPEAGQVRWPV